MTSARPPAASSTLLVVVFSNACQGSFIVADSFDPRTCPHSSDVMESDMVPACKLMEIVMQNCRGRVDEQIGPFMDLALGRLRLAEHNRLKDYCMEVSLHPLAARLVHEGPCMQTMVEADRASPDLAGGCQRDVLQPCYCPPAAEPKGSSAVCFLHMVHHDQQGEPASGRSCCRCNAPHPPQRGPCLEPCSQMRPPAQMNEKTAKPMHFKRVHDKKICILGLVALLRVPAEGMPAEVQAGLPQVFQGVVHLLVKLKEQLVRTAPV